MSSSNRVRLTSVEEVTLGTTPNTPRMRTRRFTGETLSFTPTFDKSDDIRSDRMTSDPIGTGTDSKGPVNFEQIYPWPGSPNDSDIKSAFFNAWTNTPSRDNDGTADSVITDIGTSAHVVVCTTGAAFVVGHLVRLTNNKDAANNGVFACTTGSATVPAFSAATFTADAAPAATSRMKVVGIVGGSGEISATANGLASSGIDFTTFPELVPGLWLKIGGTAAGDKFATAGLNTWVRISGAVTATAIPLDNLPSGWTTDAGTGKTVKIWYGDQIKNGTTKLGQTFEKGFLGQATPTYIVQRGMVASDYQLTIEAKKKITSVITFTGLGGAQSQATLSGSPDAALSNSGFPVFAGSANVGRVGEGGSALSSPNFVKKLDVKLSNNNTQTDAVDSLGPQDTTGHECTVTGTMDTYFGDDSLLTKLFAGTPTAINSRLAKGTQAIILDLPRITYNGPGSPQASAKNQDVMLTLPFEASKDETVTNAMILMQRMEYFE